MRKGATAAISGGFFFLGAVLSALAVILLMRRRERKLASMRWTQLDDLNDGFVDGRAASRSVDQPEEDEDGDVYEFAELESAGTRGGIRLKPGDEASDDDGDDRTRGNSSKGSGEEAPESQHLV
ncbi:hypothetical protein EC988_008715 [Linderina pennispora]|nr:hypothetical protein EC988_008715 [Linderina pennispora]